MLNILNFFTESGGSTGSTTEQPKDSTSQIIMWVVLGVLLVGMIVWMVLSQRRQKKKSQEMMSNLVVGCTITTIGGIIGEVIDMDDKTLWIETGIEGNKTTMKILRQAIHSIDPAPGSAEAIAQEKAEKRQENEEDEIK